MSRTDNANSRPRNGRLVSAALLCGLVGCVAVDQNASSGTGQGPALRKTPSWAKVAGEQVAEARKAGVPVAFTNTLGMKFVLVPAGEFMMGSPEDEPGRYPGEGPRHKVTIGKPFYVSIHQVTQGQWKALMGTRPWEGKHSTKDDPANVATWVNWNDATAFCARLSKKEGRPYRLLTEAEWEYMCRAGSTTRYFYGDDLKLEKLSEYGWWGGKGWKEGEPRAAKPPGLKKPNNWGIYDTIGSVWEMCRDIGQPNYEGAPTDGSAWMKAPEDGEEPSHSLRGGGAHSTDRRVRSASRYGYRQSAASHYVGFRICCDLAR